MKQVCPLYRVQFSMKWHNSCVRQTDRQTDSRSSVFFRASQNPNIKKGRLFLSDRIRMKKVFLYVQESEADRSGHTTKIRKERRKVYEK